jgi:hypothetical protein
MADRHGDRSGTATSGGAEVIDEADREGETMRWLLVQLRRDFPSVAEPVLAATAAQALTEFSGARIRRYVPLLALRVARDQIRCRPDNTTDRAF